MPSPTAILFLFRRLLMESERAKNHPFFLLVEYFQLRQFASVKKYEYWYILSFD
jgi:hypothetical protein